MKYGIEWDNGNHASGVFPFLFDTREEAQAFADNWITEANAEDAEGAEEASAEVIEVDEEEWQFSPMEVLDV